MKRSSVNSLKIKAKLLQKAKQKKGEPIALKNAFAILAQAAGYDSWKELKDAYEQSDLLNPPHWSAQWKNWFSSHEEAYRLLTDRLYLIPYQKHFFLADVDYLAALGLTMDDTDVVKVGHDWSQPQDEGAWNRLLIKIERFQAIK